MDLSTLDFTNWAFDYGYSSVSSTSSTSSSSASGAIVVGAIVVGAMVVGAGGDALVGGSTVDDGASANGSVPFPSASIIKWLIGIFESTLKKYSSLLTWWTKQISKNTKAILMSIDVLNARNFNYN